jgi:hypothetical protein
MVDRSVGVPEETGYKCHDAQPEDDGVRHKPGENKASSFLEWLKHMIMKLPLRINQNLWLQLYSIFGFGYIFENKINPISRWFLCNTKFVQLTLSTEHNRKTCLKTTPKPFCLNSCFQLTSKSWSFDKYTTTEQIWIIPSFGMWRRVDLVWTDVPRSRIFQPWRWRRYVPPKRRVTQDLHGATSQKTAFYIKVNVRKKTGSLNRRGWKELHNKELYNISSPSI